MILNLRNVNFELVIKLFLYIFMEPLLGLNPPRTGIGLTEARLGSIQLEAMREIIQIWINFEDVISELECERSYFIVGAVSLCKGAVRLESKTFQF